ncbi:MAG: hypothetical protein ACK55I_18670 [bacterium]
MARSTLKGDGAEGGVALVVRGEEGGGEGLGDVAFRPGLVGHGGG